MDGEKTRFSKSELAVLSHAIANTDELLQKIQALHHENRKLKQKYRSLSQSAVQVKQLYEQERDMVYKIMCQNTEIKNKIANLTRINSELEHSRINMQLTHSQAIAETELKNVNEVKVLNTILKDLVIQCKDWSEGDTKFKSALRQAVDMLEQKGVCIEKSKLIKKSRQKSGDNFYTFDCDTDMDGDETNIVKSLEKKQNLTCVKSEIPKAYLSVETNTEIKSFCDKSTTYTSSTTTRGVSTDCLVKKVDVGTTFPEIQTKNVSDIFREMIIDIPRLLSPISDKILTVDQSTHVEQIPFEGTSKSVENISTQTDNNYSKINMENTSNEFLGKLSGAHLSQLWISLGQLLFDLIQDGKICKNSGENEERAWRQVKELSNLIETRKKEQSCKKSESSLLNFDEGSEFDRNDSLKNPLSKECNHILQSAKRKCRRLDYILSPIKDLPGTDIAENMNYVTIPTSITNENSSLSLLKELEYTTESVKYLYESPKSPQFENVHNFSTPEIPLHRSDSEIRKLKNTTDIWIEGNNALKNIINNYDTNKRLHIVQKSICKNNEVSPMFENLRKSINKYLQEPWSEKSVNNLHDLCLRYGKNSDDIISAILEKIENCSNELMIIKNNLVAPDLPVIHQKIIVLIEKFPAFLKKKILNAVDCTLFSFKTISENDNLRKMMNLAHFYIALVAIDLCDEKKSNIRLFVYKALYYYNHKSFPLIYAILKANPECLPKKTTVDFDKNPLVITFESILMNSTKDKVERSDFRKKELRALLLTYYKYKPFKPTKDVLILELIERLKKQQLENLDYSFILLAKRHGYEWAMSNIIKAHLYPYLEQLMVQSEHTDIHDPVIISCLQIISAVLKTFPSNTDTTYFLQLFQTVLDRSNKPLIQEAAVEALLKLQRFGFVEIYQRIQNWNPHNDLSQKLNKMIITYVHRKDVRFWKKLNRIV
ncbi:uncharacterized protein LOC134828746 [Culicoides brevitarsis]|uniref:uncharacterized protein LOC134828746 n=1 Tax=Culicoides brevitarsis TaxID=469753 RepID=UPI00307B6DA6